MDVTADILPLLLRGRKGQGVITKMPIWRRVNHGRMTVEGEALKGSTTLEIGEGRAPREGGRPPPRRFFAQPLLHFGLPH